MVKELIPMGLKTLYFRFKILKVRLSYRQRLTIIRKKKKIKVAFLLVNESIWKYEKLYFLFKEDSRYEPVVFVCPFLTYGHDIMYREMEAIYNKFVNKNYEVQRTLNKDGTYVDIKKDFQPDLVFFCTPWGHTLKEYSIYNFLDTLNCYVPYGFKISNLYQSHFNRDTQNLCWRFFVETNMHRKLAKKYSLGNAKNVYISGFPGLDIFLDVGYVAKQVWKQQDRLKKKIIWAPHHTIPHAKSKLDYSTFLNYADLMLNIATEYIDEIQLAFKPHPNLRGKLNEVWGVEKTTIYYETWNNLPNGQLEEGEYIDLFATSDGMIHDSGSFLIEYLYTKKPVMFLINSEKVKEQFNEIGKKSLTKIYLGYNDGDIVGFIESILCKNNDSMKVDRIKFFNEIVKPPNNVTASENIFNYINKKFALNGR